MVAGVIFILFLLVGFTGLPSALSLWLMGGKSGAPSDYQVVVVLGGAGIPSESGLIRTYHGALLAAGKTGVTSVVALPCDGDPNLGSVGRMRDEMVLRGVASNSILLEYRGVDTHGQAENIAVLLGDAARTSMVVVVTAPTHVRRALMCFRRAGIKRVVGFAALSGEVEADVGARTLWRYQLWGNLQNTLQVVRELIAIMHYRPKGWV